MFKKKPNIKPLAPLRSSDRRKTADQIISDLGLTVPHSTNDASAEDKAAATSALTSLRNSLLPENTQSARFTTTAGPDLKQVSGTVYVGQHEGEEQRVLWVKNGERMFPTVYTLWRNSRIVPLLHTPGIVVAKIQGGADLMTPGLARGPPFPEMAKKGAVVAVASTDAPSVPMAVGVCEINVGALGNVQGAKGHAVVIEHWAGDEVWAWSTTGKPGGAVPEHLDGWDDQERGDENLVEKTEGLGLDGDGKEDGGVSLGAAGSSSKDTGNPYVVGESLEDADAQQPEVKEMSTKEIDDAFRKAFLYGVHHHKHTNRDQPNFGLQFPITQSLVMSNLVQPFLPAYTAAENNFLQIKKTSWKNIKKFIKSLDKEKLIKSKDRDGHEVVIMDIDFDDPKITEFTPYRLPKKETITSTAAGRGQTTTTPTAASSNSDPSIGQKLKKLDLYRPKEKLSPIFDTAKADSHAFYTVADLRPLLTTYIETEQLISPMNKRLVTLDPVLANALFDGSARLDAEVLAKGTVPRDELLDRFLHACNPFHAIVREGAEPQSNPKPKAGPAPSVLISLETRSGNKTVTRVSGLEPFFIPPQLLADELRKACAGSSSVEKAAGSSAKQPVMEVTVQGPQREVVLRALERRGVRGQWVEVVDRTKGRKR
ncbi:eukaryotic translation initiation factor SUI1 family protein [Patellaria atrata CBS 101060]|uniref:Eukaryotic translation initiation factor SUI1 family protein n=1 Tax=Patellaria atrata CBS 101060 TaxID=1346257 RepID=A0A9P4S6F6_9PEZI|nr:eukaryotic translation initiation factor SUI1 family protein [Patellaria atrata CBS 101060]